MSAVAPGYPGIVDRMGPAASASTVAAAPRPLTVVLMGDSYTAGNGARDDAGHPSYYGPEKCMRSADTWGEQYARILESNGFAVTVLNRACSAATTAAIINDRNMRDTRVVTYPEPEPADAARSDQFYVDWAASMPRCIPAPASEEYFVSSVQRHVLPDGSASVSVACERWLPAQTDALNGDVDLVLMTVGGNDVHFPDIAKQCLIMADAEGCKQQIDVARTYVRNDFSTDLLAALEAIHAKTEGHAKVGYAAYPGLEVSDDLRITSVGGSGVKVYPVAQELAALSAAGLEAQRKAVDSANAEFGQGFVTLMDEVPQLFRGHEPDARPAAVNPDRWMYEFLETTARDEWYHLKPEGHRRIAEYAATFGDFGASDDNGVARDVALVFDQEHGARVAVESALADASLWHGAKVAVVEQRTAADGVRLERRVLAQASAPVDALASLRRAPTSQWLPAADARLTARWNATAQSVFIGDTALSMTGEASVWADDRQGLKLSVDSREVDGTQSSAVLVPLTVSLRELAAAPHAWAGGPYITGEDRVEVTAQGSFGKGELTYRWDLDGDGEFETVTSGPRLLVDGADVAPGWVSVRVATRDGSMSVASAWIATTSRAASDATPCVTSDAGGVAHSQTGRRGCQPEVGAPEGPDTDEVPVFAPPSIRIAGTADAQAAVADAGHRQGRLLAALAMQPLFVDERVAAVSGGRVKRPSRTGEEGRRRPRELVLREKGLRQLMAEAGAPR